MQHTRAGTSTGTHAPSSKLLARAVLVLNTPLGLTVSAFNARVSDGKRASTLLSMHSRIYMYVGVFVRV
ncbi:hypothetical protein NDU88_001266 [Pleurodeles waltl]|uniref:Uncharacterized protein n=1 Tax=Pleurodeles waltl TaxID=8319 RepID=A0AAV7USV2_PLEWA|nr:hypothetical protein NDU88_001266 [Pleurodeles waltl]